MITKALYLLLFLFTAVNLSAQTVKITDQTKNAGKVEWLQSQYDLGKIPLGIPVTKEYTLKNISNEPLQLLEVRTTCHCTATEWTKKTIEPGQTGYVRITYDAEKAGDFFKVVKVYTNFDPEQGVGLVIRGSVQAPQAPETPKQ